jgi:DNA-binding MarR family transcriptional regulator
METNDLRTLRILEKVETAEPPSQRDLARELNISVGLVNSFIKRMAQKGYVKATTVPRKRIRYILTPKGIAAKTKLAYDYIQYSYHFYKQSRERLRRLFRELEDQGVRTIAFFGAGDLAEIAFLSLQESGIRLTAVVDDRPGRRRLLGRRVLPATAWRDTPCDRLLVTDDRDRGAIQERLKVLGIPRHKLVWVK